MENNSCFQVGGSISVNSSIYIEREADKLLFDALKSGELCYVFNSRQVGKSSLLLNVKSQMSQLGCLCCFVDISRIGSVNITMEQWYAGIVSELWHGFSIPNPNGRAMIEWWISLGEITPAQKFSHFLLQKLLTHYPNEELIIFFDEVDSIISLPFPADDFFSIIRACYNLRADNEQMKTLGFAFFGVALPSELIVDPKRSPFNIGRAISLEGFTLEEAMPLSAGLCIEGYDEKALLSAIIDWSGGQPFLTQKICQLVVDQSKDQQAIIEETIEDEQALVNQIVMQKIINDWESKDNPEHLRTIRDRLLLDEEFCTLNLDYYAQLLNSPDGYLDADRIGDYSRLYLTGLIKVSNNNISVRTKVYEKVFNKNWLTTQLEAVRPYAKQYERWQIDLAERWLLKGDELQAAKLWAEGKTLSENDYRYLTASQSFAQQVVQNINDQLQEEVKQRQQVESELNNTLELLHKATQKSEQANTAKSDFLARVSREVRTPINNVMGLTRLALQRQVEPEVRDYLQKINLSTSYMGSVINDIVDIVKLERGELSLQNETFLLDDVIDNVIDIVASKATNQGLVLKLITPTCILPALKGDPNRIQQLLLNLVTNAINYTGIGSISIVIELLSHESESLSFRFSVIDTGYGIGKESLQGIVSNDVNSVLKPGLGLSFCCELIQLLGGKLSVSSVPNEGSHFSFELEFTEAGLTLSGIDDILKIALLCSDESKNELQQKLQLIADNVKHFSLSELADSDQAPIDLSAFNKVVVEIAGIDNVSRFASLVYHNPSVEVYPLITAGIAPPNWLKALALEPTISMPSSHKRMMSVLNNTYDKVLVSDSINNFNASYHILVAEDDEINQHIVKELVKQQGLSITVVANGNEALQAIQKTHFDLVLMDIEMPEKGGLEAVSELRGLSSNQQSDYFTKLPVIAMTAHAMVNDRKRFIAAGMNDYISKPIDPILLNNVLSQWLPHEVQASTPVEEYSQSLEIENVNTESGLKRCGNNISLYLRLLNSFAKRYAQGIVTNGLLTDDLVSHFHSIKGSASNLGLDDIAEFSSWLEQRYLTGNTEKQQLVMFQELLIARSQQILSLPSLLKLSERKETTEEKPTLLFIDNPISSSRKEIAALKKSYRVLYTDCHERAAELIQNSKPIQVVLINTIEFDVEKCADLTRLIKTHSENKLAIIWLCEALTEDKVSKATNSGVTEFIHLPINMALLNHRLRIVNA